MKRHYKRPRLSLFDRSPPWADSDSARFNNDMALKSRFESIFAKYAQDFTGIGDEVDIITGEVIVNNGHLESMEFETDSGIDHHASTFTATGRSMLRAMTVAPDQGMSGPDDVLLSIETIAENAVQMDCMSPLESEDNLFDQSRTASVSSSEYINEEEVNSGYDAKIQPYHSDSDSLFENNESRSSSPDSLFANEVSDIVQDDEKAPANMFTTDRLSNPDLKEDEDILARFGPQIGREVLDLIGQRQQAHIEPAWRIPIELPVAPLRFFASAGDSSASSRDSYDDSGNQSLWKLPRRKRKQILKQSKRNRIDRDESIDPLQEDFGNGSEASENSEEASGKEDEQLDLEFEPQDDFTRDLLVEAANTGDCPYCRAHFKNKPGVMAHWDRLLRRHHENAKDDDPHDFDMMGKIRSKALVRIRGTRLVVGDFRTMVELHEGAGMSFDEIARSRTLRTRKRGLELQSVYDDHRSFSLSHVSHAQAREWTTAERAAVLEMSQNPLTTTATISRGLKGRSKTEVGNFLADTWLSQLTKAGAQTGSRLNGVLSPVNDGPSAVNEVLFEPSPVKQERSDDELFDQS